jgi:hypothetical protein
MCFSPGFGLDRCKELRGHHLDGALKHSLTHARDGPANLRFAVVAHDGQAIAFLELNNSRAFQKPRLAFAVDDDSKVTGGFQVFETNITVEQPFD